MKRVFMLGLLALLLAGAAAQATTVLYVPMKKSIQMSDYVLLGHVQRLEAGYNAEGEIVTRVHLLVEESLKGDVQKGAVFVFHARGGSLDGVRVETVGEARYELGDKVLVQLENIQGEYHTLGLSFGKWNVIREKNGSNSIMRSLFDLNMVGITESPVTILPLKQMREIAREAISY
ncbi:MAG: hypothetical protein QOH06_327 [Acidobacteriota bacterium]|jgi:hypothetical protein|nr:hypothetical protein [Acidobacteriota bacterium]